MVTLSVIIIKYSYIPNHIETLDDGNRKKLN